MFGRLSLEPCRFNARLKRDNNALVIMALGCLDRRAGIFVEDRSPGSTGFSSPVSGAIAGRAKLLMPLAHLYNRGRFLSGLSLTQPLTSRSLASVASN